MSDYRSRYGGWALIVGASEGLGRAIAEQAARRGLDLVLVARRPALLEETSSAIAAAFGVRTKAICADMADADVVAKIEAGLNGEDIGFLVYNCAAEPEGEFLKQDTASHLNNIAVNCTAPTLLVHHFGTKMVARGRGGIVLCSSLAADQGIYSYAAYGAAKAYQMILGEGLWDELADYGVDAASFMIGSTYTPNFQRGQRAKNTLFAETRTPQGLPEGVPTPQLPEEAAANLFRQLDGPWPPRIYANPIDEERGKLLRQMNRADLVKRMGDAMRTGFRSLAEG